MKKLRKNPRFSATMSVLLVITMVLTSLQVVWAAGLPVEVARFSDVTVLVDDVAIETINAVPLQQNSAVRLIYQFEVLKGTEITVGDTIEVEVPDGFVIANLVTGPVNAADAEGFLTIGEFALDPVTRMLTIVFNESVRTYDEWSGTVNILTQFDLSSIPGTANPVVITFPIRDAVTKTVSFKFRPDGNQAAIVKTGIPNRAVNPDRIQWTIQMNRPLNALTNVVVTDVIEAGQSLEASSLEVRELHVALDGTATLGAVVDPSSYSVSYEGDSKTLSVGLGDIQKAYQVSFETTLANSDQTQFANRASFTAGSGLSGSAEASLTIGKGSVLNKSAVFDRSFNPRVITWTIDANLDLYPLIEGRIIDTLPAGLTYAAGSAKLYPLTLDGAGTITVGAQISDADIQLSDFEGTQAVTANIGNTSGAYRLVFETTINVPESLTFTNEAVLEHNGAVRREDAASVTARFGTLLEKGNSVTINYNQYEILWTLEVNTVEKHITNPIIVDEIPAGLTYKTGSFSIDRITIDAQGNKTYAPLATAGLLVQSGQTMTFNLNALAGDLDYAVRIRYSTTLDDVDSQGSFSNSARLTGSGSGVNTGESYDVTKVSTANLTFRNSISKSTWGSIDYAAKRMGFHIRIRPIKEAMQDLVITDTFPNGGLTFLPETLEVFKGEVPGQVPLVLGTDYTVTLVDGDATKGFRVTFLTDIKDGEHSIRYRVSFDREAHTNSAALRTYRNNATAAWTETVGNRTDTASASYTISTTARDNGNKSGVLNRLDQVITWNVNANFLSESHENYTITDAIPENQRTQHTVLGESIQVYHYSINASGNMTQGALVDNGNYTITTLTDFGFTLTLNGTIDSPYRIVYRTALVNDTIPSYANVAILNVGTSMERSVQASVAFANSNRFVSKNNPPSGIRLAWEVLVNTSLSEIFNARLIDTLSPGHEFDRNSVVVHRITGSGPVLVSPDDYSVVFEILNAATGEQRMTLSFNGSIKDEYRINYATDVFVTQNQTISNAAEFLGDGVKTYEDNTTRPVSIVVTSAYSAAFAAREAASPRPTVRILKVDGDNENSPMAGVNYGLYDAEMNWLLALPQTSDQGETAALRLTASLYYVVEESTWDGYQVHAPIALDLSDGMDRNITLANYRTRDLRIEKVNAADETQKLTGAVFRLIGPDEDSPVNLQGATDEDGIAVFESLRFGTYTLEEIMAPSGFQRNTTIETIVIDATSDLMIVRIIENRRLVSIPTGPPMGIMVVEKRDAEDASLLLPGATFTLEGPLNSAQSGVTTLTTDFAGRVTFMNLLYGTYRLTETVVPEGYTGAEPTMIDVFQPLVQSIVTNTRLKEEPGSQDEDPTEPEAPDVVLPPDAPEEPDDNAITGEIDIPEGGSAEVVKQPEFGDVEIDENGRWTYKPGPGFTGKDAFEVIITDDEGNETLLEVEIGELDTPGGLTELPETGESPTSVYHIAGLLMVISGFALRRQGSRSW